MNDDVVLTREQLYELVWSTPIHKLAKDFGVSGVALGKTCRRMNVPPPPRGYWACVAAGQTPKRTTLPKAKQGQRLTVVLTKREKSAIPDRPSEPIDIPSVVVASSFDSPHPVVRQLGKLMSSAQVDEYDRLRIDGLDSPLVHVSVALHRRCLLVLDALAKTLTDRGHTIALKSSEQKGLSCWRIVVTVEGEEIGLSFTEKLERHPHAMTPDEKKRAKNGQAWGTPRYDFLVSGKLELQIHEGGSSRTHRDSDVRLLDYRLGPVVAEIEQIPSQRKAWAEQARQRRAEQEAVERLRQIEREAEQRRRREEDARRKHIEALKQDLEGMAIQWQKAEQLRAFLAAVHRLVPESDKNEAFLEWSDWATGYAREIDPLSSPQSVAKPTAPVAESRGSNDAPLA